MLLISAGAEQRIRPCLFVSDLSVQDDGQKVASKTEK